MWECNWWELYRTDATVKNRTIFTYQRPLSEERLMQEIRSRRLFGYVQCDLEVPEYLKAYFYNFPPIFKNTVVGTNDIGDLMREYAEKKGLCQNQEECSYQASTRKTEPSSLLYYYITCIWVLNVQKFINSFSIHPRSVPVALFSLPSMLEEMEMKIPNQA